MAWGSVIKAAGSIIGGAIASRGGSNVGPKEYRDASYGSIKGKMAAARDFGIHPLYALGSPTPGPIQEIPGDKTALAQGISDAAQVAGNFRLTRANVKAIEASATRDRAEASLLAAQERLLETKQASNVASGAVTSPADPLRRFQMTDIGTKVTGEDVRSDITELIGPYIDDWMHNPHRRDQIEAELGEMIRNAPGVRSVIKAKKDYQKNVIEGLINLQRSLKGASPDYAKRRIKQFLFGYKGVRK